MFDASDLGHSPVLMNLIYWSFLAIVAYFVTPWILLMLIPLQGFKSGDRATVSNGDVTVEIGVSGGTLSESEIREAIRELDDD